MALWLELPLGGGRRLSLLRQTAVVLGASGLGLAIGRLVAEDGNPASGAVALSLALGLALAVYVAGVPLLRRLGVLSPIHQGVGAHLCVDAEGAAFLRPQTGLAIPLTILRVHVAFGVIWLEAMADGHQYHLVSGADRVGDREWARLRAWLRWLQPGAR